MSLRNLDITDFHTGSFEIVRAFDLSFEERASGITMYG